jgi:GAF domain-containing protein
MRLIETHEERHFSADEIELARGIGEQGALAFQNARLFSSVERLAITDGLTDLYNHATSTSACPRRSVARSATRCRFPCC